MEITGTCPIELQLNKIAASARSKSELASFLYFLKKIIFNLVNDPFDETYKIIEKNGVISSLKIINTQETRELLELLGYNEESDRYVHSISDENMMKLQHCLTLLQDLIKKHEDTILTEIHDNNSNNKLNEKNSQNQSKASDQSKSKEGGGSWKLKDLFLRKHLKKEQADGMVTLLKDNKKCMSKSSDYLFNTNGYFHQSCTNKETRRNRCFISELFHHQNHDTKGWSSSGLNVKLA
jgi:hypothetical protein